MKIITIDPCFTKGDEDLFSGEAELGAIKIAPAAIEELKNSLTACRLHPVTR